MCKEARDMLLDSVIACLFFNCKSDLRNYEDAFLEPIEEGCDDSDRDIPKQKIRAADRLAKSYIEKLPALTSAKPTSTKAMPTPKPTTKADTTTAQPTPSTTITRTAESSSSSATSADSSAEDSTSAAEQTTTTEPTRVAVPTSSAEPPATTSATADDDSGGGFDTNPFGSPGGSAGSAVRPAFSLLGVSLAVGLLVLR